MTNEKAIMCLEDMKIKVPIPKAAKQARENNEALDVAIKALAESEHGTNLASLGTDAISRQAAIDILRQMPLVEVMHDVMLIDKAEAMTELMLLPPAQPKRGKWIKTARWGRVYYCDQCRNYLDFDGVNAGRGSTNFCPNCGADMRGEQDEP